MTRGFSAARGQVPDKADVAQIADHACAKLAVQQLGP
jgi:hypothetical protein